MFFSPTVVIIAFFTAWQQRVEGRGNSVRLSLRLQTVIRLQTCSMSECEDVKAETSKYQSIHSRIKCVGLDGKRCLRYTLKDVKP